MPIKQLASSALSALLALAAPTAALASAYPERPITLIVAFPPGGFTDLSSRLAAKLLSEELQQRVVVENRPGAGGTVGAQSAARSAPDGYTLFTGSMAAMVVNPNVYSDLPYDASRDFTPIRGLLSMPIVIAAPADSRLKTMADVVRASKEKPGSVSFGSSGNGSVTHLMAELFQRQNGIELLHVPYKGSAPVVVDLLGGNIDLGFDYANTTAAHIDTGKLIGVTVTGQQRLAMLPGVPTIAEAGYPEAAVTSWLGIYAPKGTPPAVVDRLSAALEKVLQHPEMISGIEALGASPMPLDPQQMAEMVQAQNRQWAPIIAAAGLKID